MSSTIKHYFDTTVVLAQKDFKIRYRNSVLGFLWSLLNPLAYMLILSLVFSFLLHQNIPHYAAWVLIAILAWRFFTVGTSQGLMSIVGNPSLVTKIYLPRYLIVLSNNTANFIGAVMEFVALLPLLVFLGAKFTFDVILLPLFLVFEFCLIFALSLSLASLNVKYRDFYQLWDIALQLGFWLSPIVYDVSAIPSRYQSLYLLNPMARLIGALRAILLFNQLPSISDYLVMLGSIVILMIMGFLIFRSVEGKFAEEL